VLVAEKKFPEAEQLLLSALAILAVADKLFGKSRGFG
jgi:hypothetical protein